MLPPAARDFYALQQRVSATTANEVRRLWRRNMGDDFDSSWRRVSPAILAVLAEGQSRMALESQPYVRRVLDDLRIPDRPVGEFVPSSLVGVASDGRPLDTLAQQSVVEAKVAVASGASTQQALDEGGAWLKLMAALQVADVARVAVGIGTASRKNVAGHIRVLNLPSCQRCAILAGRFYRWSTGFERHPRCDCTMMPVRSRHEADLYVDDPMDAFRQGQIKDLTKAQTAAINEGANISDVVNATRGMSTTATERGLSARKIHLAERRAKFEAAQEARRQASIASGMPDLMAPFAHLPRTTARYTRLTPEGIYRLAGNDRAEAIRLLRREGYIT